MRLTLLRHAEAGDAEDAADLDRALTAHGRATARAMGGQLARCGFAPGRVWVSPAVRATQTMDGVAHGFGREIATEVRAGIYLASTADLLDLLADDATGGDLMVVGHNPGLRSLAIALVEPQDDLAAAIATKDFAPCALVQFRFAASSGRAIVPGTGRVERFIPPEPA